MKFPTIKAVAADLAAFKADLDPAERDNECDVRLQVMEDGCWSVHYGDSQYDQDHRGYWGASAISQATNCRDMAINLIDQVRDHHAQCV